MYEVLTFGHMPLRWLGISEARRVAKELSKTGVVAFIRKYQGRVTLKYVDGHVSFDGTVRSPR